MKIYVLPYAGGSSLSYIGWKTYFGSNTLEILDYKGHGFRKNEILDVSIEDMAADISEQIIKTVGNEKFILFGHSMGGLVAWHAAWKIFSEYKLQAEVLCVSACPAPMDFEIELPRNDNEILENLKVSNNVNSHMLQSKYFKENMFPVIKHDYQMVSCYKFNGEVKRLPVPICVFYGMQDKLVSKNRMQMWDQMTCKECKFFAFNGGHFYFNELDNQKRLCHLLSSIELYFEGN